MRVLSVGNVYPPHVLGGYEVVWQGAMDHLRRHGHEVRMLATDFRSPSVPSEAPDDPDVRRELHWYWRDHQWPRIGPLGRLSIESHNAAVFDRHVATFRPDVLTWWPMGGMSLGLIERGRRQGLPALLFVHDYWPRYGPERDLWMRMWAGRRLGGRLADHFSTLPTAADLEHAGRWLFNSRCVLEDTRAAGLDPPSVGVLSPGISRALLEARPAPAGRPWQGQLLYIGRVVEQKGVKTAIEALPELPDARLRIVGDGDLGYRGQLEQLVDDLGLGARVSFAPPVAGDALPDEYRSADVVLFPVEWAEPWGLVPLEAMALGTPVIATGRGGSGEYLRAGDNALLFEAGDAAGLAAAVSRLAGDSELRARLHRHGLETAAAHTEERFNEGALAELERVAARAMDAGTLA